MLSAERVGALIGSDTAQLYAGSGARTDRMTAADAALMCAGMPREVFAMFQWVYVHGTNALRPGRGLVLDAVQARDEARRVVWAWMMTHAVDLSVQGHWRGKQGRLTALVLVAMEDVRGAFRAANGGGQAARAEMAGISRGRWCSRWEERYEQIYREANRLRWEGVVWVESGNWK